GGMMGPGPYFAPDPVDTFSYANSALTTGTFLMQMKLDSGTLFLDALNDPGFSVDLTAKTAAVGCPSVHNLAGLFNAVSNPECLAIRDKLIAVTHAAAVRYAFTASPAVQFVDCPNQNRPYQAFVVFGDTEAKWASMVKDMVVFGPDAATLSDARAD